MVTSGKAKRSQITNVSGTTPEMGGAANVMEGYVESGMVTVGCMAQPLGTAILLISREISCDCRTNGRADDADQLKRFFLHGIYDLSSRQHASLHQYRGVSMIDTAKVRKFSKPCKKNNLGNGSVLLGTVYWFNFSRFIVFYFPIGCIKFSVAILFQIVLIPKDKVTHLKSKTL